MIIFMKDAMFQVSTLQALSLGYSRSVITVGELLAHGDTGLGTFEDVDGEMILLDGKCYRALQDGTVVPAEAERGVPFAAVGFLDGAKEYSFTNIASIDALKQELNLKIEEDFGLNSMHIVRIDGDFDLLAARSESGMHSHHVPLKEMLDGKQQDFCFKDIEGSLVCIYYPDYMKGINASGWHLHFVSADRTKGGHVFDLSMSQGKACCKKINSIEIQLPSSPAFDTYALTRASEKEIKQVEQGKKN